MNRLSIGIVGAGEITRKLHLPVLLNVPDVEIAWLCDRQPSRAATVGKAYGVNALAAARPESLPECDVALLAIPIEARIDYLRVFAQRETAVLCEKPFAASRAQHQQLIDAFPAHRLAAGYQRRFYGSSVMLQDILSRGWFGPLRGINLAEGDRSRGSGVDHSFLDDGQAGSTRGVLFDLGTHGIDLVLHLTEAHSFEVLSSEAVFDGNIDRRLRARIILRGANTGGAESVEFNYCVSWLDRQPNIIELQFERATVWCALTPSAEVFLGEPNRPAQCIQLTSTGGARTPNQAFYLEWQAFLRGVRERVPSPLNAQTSLLTTSLMEELLTRGRSTRD